MIHLERGFQVNHTAHTSTLNRNEEALMKKGVCVLNLFGFKSNVSDEEIQLFAN